MIRDPLLDKATKDMMDRLELEELEREEREEKLRQIRAKYMIIKLIKDS